ncbi:Glyoxylase, beta-lactamase superfamily II [Rhodovulum sp. ES.010]|uniref:MBL fold metallo-hydrolase n=1 Tax=Rhodovulum sp. ES.010 TaxID=1882821 RepID=UPI000925BCD6|nr:MBL fold metallo-hydrolase [Rhodovulum sp. ES.010]SIO27330.1 Glyoxylase, beta-lactamase superfamily II [Rhodovulum sp. ES.010]
MIRTAILLACLPAPALASEKIADKYPQSVLYDKPFEVIPNVWSAIGATAPPTYENAGHNNNLSFLVTGDGVIVINGGANSRLAEALHAEIREVTDQPVKLVINENGQGHAMLGNSYWTERGVDVLAHVDAAEEFADYNAQILAGMQNYAKENGEGTELVEPTITFEDKYVIDMGEMHVEVLHLGPAHSPGDVQVWLPEQSLMIAGDLAFNGRMPPIFAKTCTSCWIETWETVFAPMNPTYIIPGHGYPTNLAQVEHHTMDYLKDLREKIRAHLDDGGSLDDAYYVDQSNWAFLDTYDELATKNAGVVFTEMEWE